MVHHTRWKDGVFVLVAAQWHFDLSQRHCLLAVIV